MPFLIQASIYGNLINKQPPSPILFILHLLTPHPFYLERSSYRKSLCYALPSPQTVVELMNRCSTPDSHPQLLVE